MLSSYFLKFGNALLFLFLFTVLAQADMPATRVISEPLEGKISASTVTLSTVSSVSVLPTIPMRGRKEMLITNTSTYTTVYLAGVSDPTTIMNFGFPIFPLQTLRIKAAWDLDIFASANTVTQLRILEIK